MKIDFNRFYSEHEQEMLMLFKKLVEINSYSRNIEGIKRCISLFAHHFPPCFEVLSEGENILAKNHDLSRGYILLVGHMDTVFPPEKGFDTFVEEGDIIRGPGVYDMKGGLIVALYALKFLEHLNRIEDIPVSFLINSDEEIGSPNSQRFIIEQARGASFGLVFEGGGPEGEIVCGRKGKLGYLLSTYGRAGHAGFFVENKPSAILEMAYKIIEIEKLNSQEKGISANVGTIEGGLGPNIVPAECRASVDIRFSKASQMKELVEQIESITKNCRVKEVEAKLEKTSGRPCMEPEKNISLWKRVEKIALSLGQRLSCEMRGGVSDANFISHAGTLVLDGLGPIGGDDHTLDEYILKSSLAPRIELTSHILLNAFVSNH